MALSPEECHCFSGEVAQSLPEMLALQNRNIHQGVLLIANGALFNRGRCSDSPLCLR